LSYPLKDSSQGDSRKRAAGRRVVERLDEIEAIARATDSQCRTWQWLKNFTSLRVGGPVAAIIYPETIKGAAQVVHRLQEAGIRWRALGHGTSILASDEVHDYVAISLRLLDERLIFDELSVQVHAGYSLLALVKATAERGLSGLESLAGLTGSIGGALRMNTEAGSDLWRFVESFTLADGGEIRVMPVADGRNCLAEDTLILAVTLRLTPGEPEQIKAAGEHWYQARMAERPDVQINATRIFGDISARPFQGTVPLSAGQIIDQLGFSGKSHGGARVSETNAEYIINEGTATADDVMTLTDLIRDQARKLRGFDLEYGIDIWKDETNEADPQ